MTRPCPSAGLEVVLLYTCSDHHGGHADCLGQRVVSRTQTAHSSPAIRLAAFSRAVASARGVARSLWMYYANPRQLLRMRSFYAQLLEPGDLAFDIGAHVGSRTLPWTLLQARVVAVEPVPQAMWVLRILYGRHPRVTLVHAAAGAACGSLPMLICEREPTVSTLSLDWAERMVDERDAFGHTRWGQSVMVPVTTLDALIEAFGVPAFCKIDVEGYDVSVLEGLSRAVPALSFEYVPPALDLVRSCLDQLGRLGRYEYNWSPGESMRMEWPAWIDARGLLEHLEAHPSQGDPGDVYARLRHH